ncbi:MAG TPA: glycerophosphodiester phosphodiesterase family protein [bacterium]|nr:glycerophosphodiester phosphodiesterase family protein [bacterium]
MPTFRADGLSVAARRPEALAHRGASAYAPENTTASFDLALAMGAHGIETDLRATRDGTVVLVHDAAVDRITDGCGDVAALTFREIQGLDAGRWFHPRVAGLRAPDLVSFLRAYGGRTTLELELKAAAAIEPSLDAVRAHGAGIVTFTSFRYALLETVRRHAPSARIGWLVDRVTVDVLAGLRALRGVQICPAIARLTADHVRIAHDWGLRVRVWGVEDRIDAWRAAVCRAVGATVDDPDLFDRLPLPRPASMRRG